MRPPGFWYNSRGFWARFLTVILIPLSRLYALTVARRLAHSKGTKMAIPVICVGNVNLGGSGKTPFVIHLAQALARRGKAVHILSRGYGGREVGPILVEATMSAKEVGDEPLLLCAFAPTWVAKDRAAGARAAQAAGAEVIIMDDGLQNPSLCKDLSVLVVNEKIGFGNGHVFPAGPLRESVDSALARCDMVLVMGEDSKASPLYQGYPRLKEKPNLTASLKILETGMDWRNLDCIAFAGIAHPQKFFQTLKSSGAKVLETHEFGDHHVFAEPVLARLARRAEQQSAQLVTTEKDYARLPKSWQVRVLPLPVRLHIKDESALIRALDNLF